MEVEMLFEQFFWSPSDPILVYEKAQVEEDGFEGALELFPSNFDPKKLQPEFSGVCVCLCVCVCVLVCVCVCVMCA